MKRAATVLLLCLVVLLPAAAAGECPNCNSIPMPGYPGPAFRLDIRGEGEGFAAFCAGTPDNNPFLHVTPGSFVAWTLDDKSTAPYVVVTFGISPFDDDVSVFVVYRGQWTWARVRDSIKTDPEAKCGEDNENVYLYTISPAGMTARYSAPGVIVCPPTNPACQ